MPPRYRRQRDKREAIGFWLIVLLICVIAGLVSYQAGKNFVGRHLAEVELQGRQARLPRSAEEEGVSREPSERFEAPLQPVVEIEERAATEAERLEMELRAAAREAAEAQPQDGAQLHTAEGEEDKTGDAEEEARTGEWVVTAGSYVSADYAQAQAARLTDEGYHPFITEIAKGGIAYHRVNVGAFEQRADAEKLQDQLQEEGFVAGLVHR